MSVAAVCVSHTPLLGRTRPAVADDVDAALAEARAHVAAFDPEVVVCVAPDHLNGFLYRVMPQICVGTAAEAIGDFGSPRGHLSVSESLATSCIDALLDAGVDVAVSHAMEVDHAFAQPLTQLLGDLDRCDVVPVFVNAAAPPRPSLRRVRAYGRTIGEWATSLGRRVLLVGSGGLSHDPPTPTWDGAPAEVRRRLLEGIAPDARAAREAGVEALATAFAAGASDLRPLAPDFDEAFLDLLRSGRLDDVERWDDDWLTQQAGRAVHELRTWVVVCSAMDVAGGLDVRSSFYRPVPEWLVGFGVLVAGLPEREVVG